MTPTAACPTPERYEQLIGGRLPEAEAEALLGHLEKCPNCAQSIQRLNDSTVTSCIRAAGTLPALAKSPLLESLMGRLIGNSDTEAAETPVEPGPRLVSSGPGFFSPAQAPDEIGRLNGYRILKQLGAGGMGTVYEAEDVRLHRRVALKVMRPEIAANERHRVRFLREARAAAKVEHDNICAIYEVGEENGVPFIAMPFLRGEPLNTFLKRQKTLPIVQAVRIAREVAEGLAAAHSAGLVHRDIKPGNVWLVRKDETRTNAPARHDAAFQRVKILDFGLARPVDDVQMTQSGAIIGTPAYMAPEQTVTPAVDNRADLFSLGVMLYEMSTGRRPFLGHDAIAIIRSLALDQPPEPHLLNSAIPAELSSLIMQLLAKSPAQRPPDARAVSEALHGVLMQIAQPIVESLQQSTTVPLAHAADATSVDPWQAIDETAPPEPQRSDSSAEPRSAHTRTAKLEDAAASSRARTSRRWLIASVLLIFAAAGGLAAYQLIFTSPNGTLVVEVEGEDADVRFQKGELHIFDSNGKRQYTLKPSERNKSLPQAHYSIEVVGTNGLKLDTDKFEITGDTKTTIRVRVGDQSDKRPKPKAKIDQQSPSALDPDRGAAEYVLGIGGSVRINNLDRDLTSVAELPRQAFQLSSVNLHGNQQVNDAGLTVFEKCRNLAEIDLHSTSITDLGLSHFKNCKNLTLLGFEYLDLSDTGLAYFQECRNLTSLSVTSKKVTDRGLAYFKDCKNLTALHLDGTQVTDSGLALFEHCRNLTAIGLEGTQISDKGLAHFKGCKNVERLYLGGTKISDAALANFNGCKNLTMLSLERTQVTDAGLSHFKDCKKLTGVALTGDQVSDAGLANFKECKNLGDLFLGDTRVTNEGLAYFKDCKDLIGLDLSGTKVLEAGLANFKECKKLRLLRLDRTATTDVGLAHFKECGDLRQLYVSETQVTDAGVAYFKECRNLGFFSALGTTIGDAALGYFKDCKGMARIDVRRTNVTAAGVDGLRKALPQCRIDWNRGVVEPKSLDAEGGPDRRAAEYVLSMGGTVELHDIDRQFKAVAELPHKPFRLKAVSLENDGSNRITNAGFASFKGCRHLTHVGLWNLSAVGDAGIANFKDSKGLILLQLHGMPITDEGLGAFKGCKDLTRLGLSDTKVSDAGLGFFKDCKNLTDLSLVGTSVGDMGLAFFQGCKKLSTLELAGTQIGDAGLANFKESSKQMMKLQLSGTHVTDAGLANFQNCPRLWYLILPNNSAITDAGLANFKGCKELKQLDLSQTVKIGDAGLANFKDCKNLYRVTLGGTQVSDLGLSPAKSWKGLVLLNLNRTRVSDAGLESFKEFAVLEVLGLDGTKISDAGLANLKNCKKLSHLTMYGTKVTAAGINDLKKALPQCQPRWDGEQAKSK